MNRDYAKVEIGCNDFQGADVPRRFCTARSGTGCQVAPRDWYNVLRDHRHPLFGNGKKIDGQTGKGGHTRPLDSAGDVSGKTVRDLPLRSHLEGG